VRFTRVSPETDTSPAENATPTPLPPAAAAVLALQRSAGNQAVARLVQTAGPAPVTVLDQDSSHENQAEAIAAHLVATEDAERGLGFHYVQAEILAALEDGALTRIAPLLARATPIPMGAVAAVVAKEIRDRRDQRHRDWLDAARAEFEDALRQRLPPGVTDIRGRTLREHEELAEDPMAEHYAQLDDSKLTGEDMIWRFTSQPQSEVIVVAEGTPFKDIYDLVGAHSGGNKKNDPRVRTLSFGRNLGALIGVAYSTGGDANVAGIAVRAEYLYGISLASLQGKGITAHPAEARMISVFETEYVLVATPGDPPRKLDDLATVRYANPFKGIDPAKGKAPLLAGKKLNPATKQKAPEQPGKPLDTPPRGFSSAVWEYARKAQAAATQQYHAVRDMDAAESRLIDSAMGKYIEAINTFDPNMHATPKPKGPPLA
jgi:hypothetical protein